MLVVMSALPNASKSNPAFKLEANGTRVNFFGKEQVHTAIEKLSEKTGVCTTEMQADFPAETIEDFKGTSINEQLVECFNVDYSDYQVTPWPTLSTYFKTH